MSGTGAPAPAPDAADRLPIASLARRLAALGYESLLLTALVLVIGFFTVPLARTGGEPHALAIPGPAGRAFSACLVFAAAGAYCTWSWSGGRRTLAMKTWGLRLAQADGATVDVKRALRRYFAAWIGPLVALVAYATLQRAGLGAHATWVIGLNYLWALVDPERQFLHDRIAGTRILSAPRP